MKVFLALESAEIFYHYKSVIAVLASRGHEVDVFFAKGLEVPLRPANSLDVVKKFAQEIPNFSYGGRTYQPDALRTWIVFPARAIANYRRFLKMTGKPPFYKERYRKQLPFLLKHLAQIPILNFDAFIRGEVCGKMLARIERSIPPDRNIIRTLERVKPDVVLVSSGNVVSSSPDFEYLRAARHLGIPNALLAASWDYLETKGLVHVAPDTLLVWNKHHEAEAIASHGISAEKISIVGAPLFDDFFRAMRPSMSREAFFKKYGLRERDPVILYIGSSGIFGDESRFLKSVRQALNASGDDRIRKTQIIVRPHPISRSSRNYRKMAGDAGDVVLIPELGELPSTEASLQLFFDTLSCSDAVVSIGSSGLINALIAGKPSATVLVDYYSHLQSGAPHFKHLLESGAIYVAKDFDEIPDFLKTIRKEIDPCKEHRERFIAEFIRPRGLRKSAGAVVAEELERVALQK